MKAQCLYLNSAVFSLLCHNMILKHFENVSESGHGCIIFEEVDGTSLPLAPCSLALFTVNPKAVRILII